MEAAKSTEPYGLSSSQTTSMVSMSITDPYSKLGSPLSFLSSTTRTQYLTPSHDVHHHHQLPKPVRVRSDFKCNYCHRKFHSAQALGGHQNAHRRERSTKLAQSKHQSSNGKAAMDFSYSNVQRHHGYSMMHKPAALSSLSLSSSSFSYPSSDHLSGQYGLSRTTLLMNHHHGRLGRLFDGGQVAGVPSPCVTKLMNIGGKTVGPSMVPDCGIGAGLLGGGTGRLMKTNEEELGELDLSLKL